MMKAERLITDDETRTQMIDKDCPCFKWWSDGSASPGELEESEANELERGEGKWSQSATRGQHRPALKPARYFTTAWSRGCRRLQKSFTAAALRLLLRRKGPRHQTLMMLMEDEARCSCIKKQNNNKRTPQDRKQKKYAAKQQIIDWDTWHQLAVLLFSDVWTTLNQRWRCFVLI